MLNNGSHLFLSCARTTVVVYGYEFLLIEHGAQYLAESRCSASDLDAYGMSNRISSVA